LAGLIARATSEVRRTLKSRRTSFRHFIDFSTRSDPFAHGR